LETFLTEKKGIERSETGGGATLDVVLERREVLRGYVVHGYGHDRGTDMEMDRDTETGTDMDAVMDTDTDMDLDMDIGHGQGHVHGREHQA
jgi:hypothetical protein